MNATCTCTCTCTATVECDSCCDARFSAWDAAKELARARLALESAIPRVRLMGKVTPHQNRIAALHGVAAPARRAYVRALASHARALKAYKCCKSCDVTGG